MGEIKHLESNGILQILLFLLGRERTKVTDIEFEGSNSTMYRALNTLSRLELIDEERVKPYTRYIHLTGDGEAVAKKLKEIEQILKTKKGRQRRQAHP